MAITELFLGQLLVKDQVTTEFYLKADGLVYLREATTGKEYNPITVAQFMHGMSEFTEQLAKLQLEASDGLAVRKPRLSKNGKRIGRPPKTTRRK